MSSDTERAIEEILNDFERQPIQDRRTFRAYLNQPELISLSSTNAQQQSAPISPLSFAQYYNFTVNLPRPALDAKSLQLLKAVIPQANASIPDYSLVFPYYRLRTLPIDDTGQVHFVDKPTYANLYFIRLLQSYYKRELVSARVVDPNALGYNQTFNDYEELEIQLKKACREDLSFGSGEHYLADDITFIYDRTINKFLFRGLATSIENTYDLWDNTTSYVTGDVVEYDVGGGELHTYLAITNSLSNEPPDLNTAAWFDSTPFFDANENFNAYLIAGYNDPNVKTLLEYVQTYSTQEDSIFYASIPGNQAVEGQTLARRLGFTWDGNGLIVDAINDYYENGIDFGGTIPIFYNRFRVVPTYEPRPAPPLSLIKDSILGSVDTYTADGYCNLVYSSIISIYTTIVGTSTVDTQRNANLLAMIPMDCGNLGVAMVGNYIENALTKIQGDIYSIYIELRDENGEPYYLTNNATTTLLIKLTY
jgi:hypothetical protein